MNTLFILVLGLSLLAFQGWMFKLLTGERWQFLATIPLKKNPQGEWLGLNLTYYGVFTATSLAIGVILFILMMASVGNSLTLSAVVIAALLAVCLPSARLVARIVEGKSHTFTIGGATFVGIICAPLFIEGSNLLMAKYGELSLIPTMAAMSIAYSFGEGIGRLACVSFGCCYGKPMQEMPNWVQKVFGPLSFTFSGETRKACYASELHGIQILPIQAITSVLYVLCGLIGLFTFLEGFYFFALMFTLAFTQFWRLYSETLRADYRGGQKISPYQIMTVVAVVYTAIFMSFYPAPEVVEANLINGLSFLWSPEVILGVQAIWLLSFFYTGTSTVTSSNLKFQLHRDRI
ncbi:prolipoprotein diacylglyceryl transferase family protein [Litoribacillus peritrichatus]|uniref:Prolipoprotein diacylglyceryl transferase n=1 Tax=Litoribacillus peritrichatus TaxID=718191 RepID=A0ABP7MG15_9GAMM